MKKIINSINGIIVFLLLLWGTGPCAYALEDAIVAIVNDDIITLKEMREFLSTVYFQLQSQGKTPSEIENIMRTYQVNGLNKMIEEKLLIDEANSKGVIVNEKAIGDRLEEIKTRYASIQDFEQAVIDEGLTISDLKERLSNQIKTKYIIDMEVRSKIFVNPQEVTEYYQDHIYQFQKPERVDLQSIFISYGEDKQKAIEKSKKAFDLIDQSKDDFEKIAEQYSDLPSVGLIEKGQLLNDIEEVVFKLAPGEVAQPIETEDGIYIFKVKEKHPEKLASLEETKDKIYALIFQQKFRDRLNTWLLNLKQKAYVEIKQ